jgi:translation initiation factor IF-2
MRVHELAKELGVKSRVVLDILQDVGVEAKSHMSTIEDEVIDLLRNELAAKPAAKAGPAEATPEAIKASAVTPEPVATAKPDTVLEPVEAKPRKAAPQSPKPPPKAQKPGAISEPAKDADRHEEIWLDDGNVIRTRGAVVVRDLAELLGLRPNVVIAELMGVNVLASINERIEINVARQICEKHGFTLEHEKRTEEHRQTLHKRSDDEEEEIDKPEDLRPRAPVVTFLGHVDHGKTSLLDKIRDTAVTEGEFGGITQHIGAYTVDVQGRPITFLDTPGHAAFTAMRSRGASLTDIAVIIIAADDGVMPQTREAIQHAKNAGVAIMVAVNKMDLPGANPDQVRQQLSAEGLTPEEWGGETICCPVSAHTGQGIDHLLEMILLQAELLELQANPKRRGHGFVVEAQLEPGMGPTAHLLVKNGTLQIGDIILCGRHAGRVRALINDHGIKVKSAGPSTPVKCLGLTGVPEAGTEFKVYANEKLARQTAASTAEAEKRAQLVAPRTTSVEALFDQIRVETQLEFPLVLKADVQGSVEAIEHALDEIKSDKILLRIISRGAGSITVNDVKLAGSSGAMLIGFNVTREPGVKQACKQEGVQIKIHKVIYELLDDVREAMVAKLPPLVRENITGHAEIRQVFSIGKAGNIAGCLVTDGVVTSRSKARVKRGQKVLHEGVIASLRHFQDEVSQVREAQECGVRLADYADFLAGDTLEFYELEQVKQTL